MKFDRAYCTKTDCILTIYQVRDLHFDVDEEFDSKKMDYECPDEDCDAILTGVNDTSVEFKVTPHFRTIPSSTHSDDCDYEQAVNLSETKIGRVTGNERGHKVSDIPEVFLLERQIPPIGSGKPKKKRVNDDKTVDIFVLDKKNEKNTSVHETSCLEHIIEVWESNCKDELEDKLLTIGNKTKWYRNMFKHVEYFADEEGLIYYGDVKDIKAYGKNYSIRFMDKPRFPNKEGKRYPLSIYIKNELIDVYRRRKQFRKHIDLIKGKHSGEVTCYFVGAYPNLCACEGRFGSFDALEVEVKNLDHIVLRHRQGGEE